MKELLYFTMAAASGGLIGWGTATFAARMPGRVYRGWIQECADVLGQADQLEGVRPLAEDQAMRAKQVGAELESAIADHPQQEATKARKLVTAIGLGAAFVGIAAVTPPGLSALIWMGFAGWLAAMSAVDWDSTLLPDSMTIPFIWVGLFASWAGGIEVHLHDSVAGALAGYLSLRLVHEGYKAITGQEGMGHGDFKLLSGIGAWLGAKAILPVLIVASLTGLVVSAAARLRKTSREGGVIPFGPFLAAGALVVAMVGTDWRLPIS